VSWVVRKEISDLRNYFANLWTQALSANRFSRVIVERGAGLAGEQRLRAGQTRRWAFELRRHLRKELLPELAFRSVKSPEKSHRDFMGYQVYNSP
jgi:hypothetical protein